MAGLLADSRVLGWLPEPLPVPVPGDWLPDFARLFVIPRLRGAPYEKEKTIVAQNAYQELSRGSDKTLISPRFSSVAPAPATDTGWYRCCERDRRAERTGPHPSFPIDHAHP
jgi:hypothetical protein